MSFLNCTAPSLLNSIPSCLHSASSSSSFTLNPPHSFGFLLPSTTSTILITVTTTSPSSSSFPLSCSTSLGSSLSNRRFHSHYVSVEDRSLLRRCREKHRALRVGYTMETRDEAQLEEPPLRPILGNAKCQLVSKPRRVALFVEPSPFAYVSGYKNRFQNFIKHLREMGDEVMVVTTHEGIPKEFHGAKCIGSLSFPCPWYTKLRLSLALSPRIILEVARFKPDIIHASSPGVMVFGAVAIAKALCVPIVLSYHTHVPIYIPRYTFSWLVKPMWMIIKFLHRAADLTLVPSAAIGQDLEVAGVASGEKIRLWNKGVDSESFHPRFRNQEMRARLCDGEPEKPLIIHVGRLGVEKSLDFLKRAMDQLPEARIAFVGDGPYRSELEKMFQGMPAVFTGMLEGEELSQAYASGDVFVTPSETETLGFVVMEAMSSGVPVVAARAGGIVDIIIPGEHDGRTGFLFKPGDVDDCVAKIRRLLCNKEFREIIAADARTEMERHDWRAATRKVRDEAYNAAIWFWLRSRARLLSYLPRWFKTLLRSRPTSGWSGQSRAVFWVNLRLRLLGILEGEKG